MPSDMFLNTYVQPTITWSTAGGGNQWENIDIDPPSGYKPLCFTVNAGAWFKPMQGGLPSLQSNGKWRFPVGVFNVSSSQYSLPNGVTLFITWVKDI